MPALTRRHLGAAAAMLVAGTGVVFATYPAAAAAPNLLANPGWVEASAQARG